MSPVSTEPAASNEGLKREVGFFGLLEVLVGAEAHVGVGLLGRGVDPAALVAVEGPLVLIGGHDVLAQLGTEGLEDEAQVPDDGEVPQHGVLALEQVVGGDEGQAADQHPDHDGGDDHGRSSPADPRPAPQRGLQVRRSGGRACRLLPTPLLPRGTTPDLPARGGVPGRAHSTPADAGDAVKPIGHGGLVDARRIGH
jgi:hypothetical protein